MMEQIALNPVEAAAEIAALINDVGHSKLKSGSPEWRRNWDRQQELQRFLAEQFAVLRGWHYGGSRDFRIHRLYGNPDSHDGWGYDGMMFDHPHYFRTTDKPRKPVAVAAHLYDWDSRKEQYVAEFCRTRGLHYEAVSNFPSWWYPGWTQMVVYTRAAETPVIGEPHGTGD